MPHTSFCAASDQERQAMLAAIGAKSFDDLFRDIPREDQTDSFNVPEGRSEFEVMQVLRGLAACNSSRLTNFCGAGFYDHFIPAAVDALASRGEFFTAYTPYQPEASQGTLQAIYEWQTAVSRLTEMEVANASLYDGGTALFEGIMMALRATDKQSTKMHSGPEGLGKLAGGVSRRYHRTDACVPEGRWKHPAESEPLFADCSVPCLCIRFSLSCKPPL